MSARKRTKKRFTLPDLGLPTGNRRPAKVAETLQNEIALLLLRKISDPRVTNITISGVKITDDLRTAFVFFSCSDDSVKSAEEGLASAQGFIRSCLSKKLALRYMPKLIFKHDLSVSHHDEMNRIFREIENDRQSPA